MEYLSLQGQIRLHDVHYHGILLCTSISGRTTVAKFGGTSVHIQIGKRSRLVDHWRRSSNAALCSDEDMP